LPLTENTDTKPILAFTVDVEEYYHVTGFQGTIPRSKWQDFPSRVEQNTLQLLDILFAADVKGTFFILGCVAESNPRLVKEIYSRGHEIASHGYDHKLISTLSASEFRMDIRQSKHALQDITGGKIIGYRAPTFSIKKDTSWVYEILFEEGFHYSSSVFPVRHDRYGWPNFGDRPKVTYSNKSGSFWEIPLPRIKIGPVAIPFGGGGYLRLYPYWLTSLMLQIKAKQSDSLPIVYCHPWEIDKNQPKVSVDPLNSFRHYFGITGLERKLTKLMKDFRLSSIHDSFAYRWDSTVQ
jgi:polysaccharide deacetylase family protein (PEP-CTERM system associated)